MKELASKYHAGQFRKGRGKIPYILHPQAVAELLCQWGENPDSAIVDTAWGHDLLEDTRVTDEEIIAAAGLEVLNNIKRLTCPEEMEKSLYMQSVADCGNRDVLLVKTADRICNSRDFVKLKGKLHAFRYMKKGLCLTEALEKFRGDQTAEQALREWEELYEELREGARHEAVRACMLGGAVGDALGAPVEFLSREEILKKYGPKGIADYVEFPENSGAVTDDTQMALFTAEGLLRAETRLRMKGICSPESVGRQALLRWLRTQERGRDRFEGDDSGWLIREERLFQRRAPGLTCLKALEENSSSLEARNDSKGCGTVMRMAPVGLFLEPEQAWEYGCRLSAITHGHPTGITAGGAFAMLTAFLLKDLPLHEALDLTEAHLTRFPEASETLEAVKKARKARKITELGEGWVAEEALAIGIFCALRYGGNFRKGVLAAVNITGDSDSAGTVAGHLLGLLNGEKAIPARWRKKLREYDIVSQMADDLYLRYEADSRDEATEVWWEKYPGY